LSKIYKILFPFQARLNATSYDEIQREVNKIRNETDYDLDVSRIGKFRRKRNANGTVTSLPAITHGITYNSIWNTLPHFHVMRPGMLIPCMQHDVMAGIARREMSLILIDIAKSKFVSWKSLQIKFKNLKSKLLYHDKRDFSSKLTGNCN